MIHTFCLKKIKIEKVEKLVANLCDKNEYVIHIRNLEQALNHRLVLKQVHRIIKSNQKAWLKPHINMNTDPRNKAKMIFKKYFFKLMNTVVFGKTTKNLRKIETLNLYNIKKNKIFGIRTKIWYNNFFFWISISNRNEKNTDTYE